jgi:hypothetical protein
MTFLATSFFDGFVHHLETHRADELRYAAVAASPEHWIQIEALCWLNSHRDQVGIGGGDAVRPAWGVWCEQSKVDLWLQRTQPPAERCGVAIELKILFNNKNFTGKLWEVRRDLSPEKRLPNGYSDANTARYALAVLIYVRYAREHGGGYPILRNGRKGPVPPEEFLKRFGDEIATPDASSLPPVRILRGPDKVVSLDGQPYMDPDAAGCGVWLALCGRGSGT